MKANINIYDCKTGKNRIEQVEAEDMVEEPPIIPQEPTLEEQIAELEETNKTQDELINTTMLATDEMYMMIEPLLSEAVQTLSLERSVSKMVDMYVAMVQRGLKTIDEVPARYREQVKEILAQLEK